MATGLYTGIDFKPNLRSMTEHPKVTVVIPTYNRAHLLPRAVRSVLAQTFTDYEIIIVDDASVDNTQQVLKIWGGGG